MNQNIKIFTTQDGQAQSRGFVMDKADKSIEPNLKKMTEADLRNVLKTVNKSIAESMSRAEKAHKERLSQIKTRYA